MKPKKKGLLAHTTQPVQCMIHALSGLTIHQAKVFLEIGLPRKRVIVEIETPTEPPTSIQDKRADNCTCGITMLFEALGERPETYRERLTGEILDPVREGVCAGQDGSMRRPSEGNLGDSSVKPHSLARQGIYERRLYLSGSVASEAVRAQSIHGDKDNRGRRGMGCGEQSRRNCSGAL